MPRLAIALGLLSLLGLAAPAHAQLIAYTTTLSGPNESPPNASPGTGTSTVFYDPAAHTLRVVVSFSGLTANTTASHIHCCVSSPGGTAGVATTTPTFAGFPLGVTAGTYDNTLDLTSASSWNSAFVTANGGTTAGAEAKLAAGLAAGQAYLNIHSTLYPAGEIRGFLAAAAPPPVGASTAIPTLSQWGMIGLSAALGIAGFLAARVRRG